MGKRRSATGSSSRSKNRSGGSTADLPVIGIIGIQGRYGRWLERRFVERGHQVLGCDRDTSGLSAPQLVRASDVVVFAVPIQQTVAVIDSVLSCSRSDQLWVDITSLKEVVLQAMLASRADVIGLHPMCGPDLPNWNGQTVAVCYGRVRSPHWETFILDWIRSLKANFYVTDPVEHDRIMAYVQALPHALSMLMIGTFESMEQHGLSVSEIEHYATPPYRLAVAAMARILAAHPDLYADIQICNQKHTVEVLRMVEREAGRLRAEVEGGDRQAIVERLLRGRRQFRSRNIQSGMKGFLQMSRVMADLSSDNSKVIHTRRDQPGLLEQILAVLARHQVNLSGLHSFKTDEYEGFSFQIGLECGPDDLALQKALCEMRNHPLLGEWIVVEDP